MLHPAFLAVARPGVVAAWDQLLHEDSFPAAPPARPRRLPLALLLGAGLALALALALGALAGAGAGARKAAAELRLASQGADPAALLPLADWPRLRAYLTAGLLASLPAEPPPYLAQLAQDVADGLATAGPLHALLRDRLATADSPPGPPWPAAGGWRVRLGDGVALTFAPAAGGAGWVLVDLALEPGDD